MYPSQPVRTILYVCKSGISGCSKPNATLLSPKTMRKQEGERGWLSDREKERNELVRKSRQSCCKKTEKQQQPNIIIHQGCCHSTRCSVTPPHHLAQRTLVWNGHSAVRLHGAHPAHTLGFRWVRFAFRIFLESFQKGWRRGSSINRSMCSARSDWGHSRWECVHVLARARVCNRPSYP